MDLHQSHISPQQQLQQLLREYNPTHIIGVDEAGRGTIAGPVMVAAAAVPALWYDKRIRDSKLFGSGNPARQRRESALRYLSSQPITYKIRQASALQVDLDGIDGVTRQMSFALVEELFDAYPNSVAVFDMQRGFQRLCGGRLMAMVKADRMVPAVSAASVAAKVAHDREMVILDRVLPKYEWGINMGYFTPRHTQLLFQHGACALHRKSTEPVRAVLAGVTLEQWRQRKSAMHA